MSKLRNKVAIVTGASRGIGAGIAFAFAAEEAAVVVNYASSKKGVDKVVGQITARPAEGPLPSKATSPKGRMSPDSFKKLGKLSALQMCSSTTRVFSDSGRSPRRPNRCSTGTTILMRVTTQWNQKRTRESSATPKKWTAQAPQASQLFPARYLVGLQVSAGLTII